MRKDISGSSFLKSWQEIMVQYFFFLVSVKQNKAHQMCSSGNPKENDAALRVIGKIRKKVWIQTGTRKAEGRTLYKCHKNKSTKNDVRGIL